MIPKGAVMAGIKAMVAGKIHYPECWDTAAYPELEDALVEVAVAFPGVYPHDWATSLNDFECQCCKQEGEQ
ncbi:hypothetical protein [Marinimicrobium sp. C2-29]|uniref:hypothetical protein n=1 Tax=Marinimicrobium sp. C2-29 TaxID=3139825 RepID=UPI003138F40E